MHLKGYYVNAIKKSKVIIGLCQGTVRVFDISHRNRRSERNANNPLISEQKNGVIYSSIGR